MLPRLDVRVCLNRAVLAIRSVVCARDVSMRADRLYGAKYCCVVSGWLGGHRLWSFRDRSHSHLLRLSPYTNVRNIRPKFGINRVMNCG
jgi:hypothetical protein